jgi:hypothetical protein
MAENLIAAALGLEVATGNDAMSSHSDMRKTAKLMLQFLPGSDFITSGYSSMPRQDNMFGGGNFDADDMDDWLVIQRDMKVDAGMVPVTEAQVLEARRRAAKAIQAVFDALGFPKIDDAEVEAAVYAYASNDMPERDLVADLAAADKFLDGPLSAVDVIKALDTNGFTDIAANVLGMQRARVIGDYLQPAAILDKNFKVESAFSDPNDYRGPGTGFRLEGAEWREIANIPQAKQPRELVPLTNGEPGVTLIERGPARESNEAEVVIALGPAFAAGLDKTLCGLSHGETLKALCEGIASQDIAARIVKYHHTADCGILGHEGAKLSGSGIAIGLQSKGTAVIQRKGLAPLNNLELFPSAPLLSREAYFQIGANAACHAKREPPAPVPVKVDNMARLRLIVHATLMHKREIAAIVPDGKPMEVEAVFDA